MQRYSRTSISGTVLRGRKPVRRREPWLSDSFHRHNLLRLAGVLLSGIATRVSTSRLSDFDCVTILTIFICILYLNLNLIFIST
jgi:hypothetical protein